MDKAIITLSFDDGRQDNLIVAREILKTNNIPATFNIATGYIEGNVQAGSGAALCKQDVLELSQDSLFEIAAHGDQHRNDWQDIEQGRKKLLEWLGFSDTKLLGFASPGSEMNLTYIHKNQEYFKQKGFLYIRTGCVVTSKKVLRVIARKLGRVFHSRKLFEIAYSDSMMRDVDDIAIVSIPVLHDTTLGQVVRIIERACREKCWCVLMFHSIVKKGNLLHRDTWSWDYDKFNQLAIHLKNLEENGLIQLANTEEAYIELSKKKEK